MTGPSCDHCTLCEKALVSVWRFRYQVTWTLSEVDTSLKRTGVLVLRVSTLGRVDILHGLILYSVILSSEWYWRGTLSLPSPIKVHYPKTSWLGEMCKWGSENWKYNHLGKLWKSLVLRAVWCNISGEAARNIWNWSNLESERIDPQPIPQVLELTFSLFNNSWTANSNRYYERITGEKKTICQKMLKLYVLLNFRKGNHQDKKLLITLVMQGKT